MKIQFFSKALKGNLKNEVLKAAFAAGLRGIFFKGQGLDQAESAAG